MISSTSRVLSGRPLADSVPSLADASLAAIAAAVAAAGARLVPLVLSFAEVEVPGATLKRPAPEAPSGDADPLLGLEALEPLTGDEAPVPDAPVADAPLPEPPVPDDDPEPGPEDDPEPEEPAAEDASVSLAPGGWLRLPGCAPVWWG